MLDYIVLRLEVSGSSTGGVLGSYSSDLNPVMEMSTKNFPWG